MTKSIDPPLTPPPPSHAVQQRRHNPITFFHRTPAPLLLEYRYQTPQIQPPQNPRTTHLKLGTLPYLTKLQDGGHYKLVVVNGTTNQPTTKHHAFPRPVPRTHQHRDRTNNSQERNPRPKEITKHHALKLSQQPVNTGPGPNKY